MPLLLIVMPSLARSSYLLLVVSPGASSSDALVTSSCVLLSLLLVASCYLGVAEHTRICLAKLLVHSDVKDTKPYPLTIHLEHFDDHKFPQTALSHWLPATAKCAEKGQKQVQ